MIKSCLNYLKILYLTTGRNYVVLNSVESTGSLHYYFFESNNK